MKSGSVLYNFIDTKLNFDTNRLSAVCKHDICCTRIQPGVATTWPRCRWLVWTASLEELQLPGDAYRKTFNYFIWCRCGRR